MSAGGEALTRRGGSTFRPPRWSLAAPALLWWLFFFVAAFVAVGFYSLGQKAPYTAREAVIFEPLTLGNYEEALSPVFLQVFWITLRTAGLGTLACLLVGFPVAYALATRVPQRLRPWLLFFLILPYWISFLLRTFAWRIILAPEGAFSGFLQSAGVLEAPLAILDTQAAVQLGIIYNYLPVAILPIFVALDRIDPELRRASMDLGAGRMATFLEITLPLAAPGIIAAALLTFVLAAGDYVVPAILGGARGLMIGTLIAIQILGAQNLPLGAAMAVTLIAILALGGAVVAIVLMLIKLAVRATRGPAI
jgi:spermidine/putrescine transport system permease protein